jgi:hypothetical protein
MGHGGVPPLTPNLVTNDGGYLYVSNASSYNTATVTSEFSETSAHKI